jgi:hypothetical protein
MNKSTQITKNFKDLFSIRTKYSNKLILELEYNKNT